MPAGRRCGKGTAFAVTLRRVPAGQSAGAMPSVSPARTRNKMSLVTPDSLHTATMLLNLNHSIFFIIIQLDTGAQRHVTRCISYSDGGVSNINITIGAACCLCAA